MVRIEFCIDSYKSARVIADKVKQGDNRIELCGSLINGGGHTPSMGLLRYVQTIIPSRKIMVMIRPRLGSFLYTPSEVETMLCEIEGFKKEDVGGFVFGCLTRDGEVDVDVTKRLVEASHPFPVTFHRAFDITPNWEKAFDDITQIQGITRILTSGHAPRAIEGIEELKSLISKAKALPRNLVITLASGINASAAAELLEKIPHIEELHLTGSGSVIAEQTAVAEKGRQMGFGLEEWRLDSGKIDAFWDVLQKRAS